MLVAVTVTVAAVRVAVAFLLSIVAVLVAVPAVVVVPAAPSAPLFEHDNSSISIDDPSIECRSSSSLCQIISNIKYTVVVVCVVVVGELSTLL